MTELIDEFKQIDTPTVSNAVELLNVRKRSEISPPCRSAACFPTWARW